MKSTLDFDCIYWTNNYIVIKCEFKNCFPLFTSKHTYVYLFSVLSLLNFKISILHNKNVDWCLDIIELFNFNTLMSNAVELTLNHYLLDHFWD